MKKHARMTKAELIKCIKALEMGAPVQNIAFERERLLHELQVHQIELETQNRDLREAQLLLENSRDRYADLYDFAPVGYATFDHTGVTREINLTAAGMLCSERTRLVGVPFHLHVAREDLPQFREHLAKLAAPDERVTTELRLVQKGGGVIPVVMQSVLVYDAEKKGYLCRSALTDITASKQAEEALRNNEARLSAILETAVEGIITIDESGLIESFNTAAARLFGYTAAEIMGQNVGNLMPSPYREQHDSYIANYRTTGERKIIGLGREVAGQRKDGSTFPLDLSVSEVQLANRRIFTGFVRDITERKELEKEILETTEREQNRIGQDLHDGLCQHLAGVEFRLLGLKQNLEAKSNPQAAETAEIAKLVREAIDQTRTLAHGLSPVMMAPDAVMTALQGLAGTTQKTFKISCSVNCPTPVLIHENAVATHLYRIAQEAVHNAVRHGKAKFIVINLLTQNGRIILGVKDDGVGFPKNPRKHNGMGLRVMQYRAGMVGGSLVVQRDPDGGTSVICSLRAGSMLETPPPRGNPADA